MSGFCLIRPVSAERRELEEQTTLRQLNSLGFLQLKLKRAPSFSLVLFGKKNGTELEFVEEHDGNFAFGAGAVIYSSVYGRAAVSRILNDFDGTANIVDRCLGNFCLVIFKNSVLHILTNKICSFTVFHDDDYRYISSSFLCLCNLLPKLSLDVHNVFEFVAKGFVTGDETPFEQCRSFGPGTHLVFAGSRLLDQSIPPLPPAMFKGSCREGLDAAAKLLREKVAAIVTAYGDDITCALSGGFDSRLMLALLREQGVSPALYVYGGDKDPDVLVSSAICDAEGFELRHVDKEAATTPSTEEFGCLVRRNFLSADGYYYSGIFNNGAELRERRIRCQHSLILNGGGGEVLRVFFQLLDRAYSIKQFVEAYFANLDSRGFSSLFSRAAFVENVATKVVRIGGCNSKKLDRYVIEWLYPMFRCRSFFGRYESTYNWDGASILPFFDIDVGYLGAGLPIQWKRCGGFEAKLIAKIAPRLAAYRSVYGPSFIGSVGWKRLAMELLSSSRPPELRHSLWLLQNVVMGQGTSDRSPLLSQPYVDSVFKDRDYVMAQYFHLSAVTNPEYINRIYTLEYLAREFSGKLQEAA